MTWVKLSIEIEVAEYVEITVDAGTVLLTSGVLVIV